MTQLPADTSPPPPAPALNYALWGDRVIAALIDFGIVLLITFVLYGIFFLLSLFFAGLAAAEANASRSGADSPLGLFPCCICCGAPVGIAFVGLLFGLFNKVFLVGTRGCSIGQGFRHLRVVLPSGERVPYGTLILRLFIEFGFGLIWIVQVLDLLFPLWDEKRQTLHDKAVGTFVIKVSG